MYLQSRKIKFEKFEPIVLIVMIKIENVTVHWSTVQT